MFTTRLPAGTAKAGEGDEVADELAGSATDAAVCTGVTAGTDDATGLVFVE